MSVNFVTIDVRLAGLESSQTLNILPLPAGTSVELGDDATVSRSILLSINVPELLTFTASVATLGQSAIVLGRWLFGLTKQQAIIERIGRTEIEQVTEDGIIRIVHEELERELRER